MYIDVGIDIKNMEYGLIGLSLGCVSVKWRPLAAGRVILCALRAWALFLVLQVSVCRDEREPCVRRGVGELRVL